MISAAVIAGCGGDDAPADAATSSTGVGTSGVAASTGVGSSAADTTAAVGSSGAGESTGGEPAGPWSPGTVYPSLPDPNPRGLLDVRGLVHTHSPFSHDACDEAPRDAEGHLDATCVEDLRRGICQTRHDFIMLTDHPDSFAASEYPDVLLYDAARGDALVERDGAPIANWSGCDDGSRVLVMPGCEGATMPVGLAHHVADRGLYTEVSAEAIAAFVDADAVPLVAHTEDWTIEQLETLPLAGFEMFNLHANTLLNVAAAVQLLGKVTGGGEGLPHPDLAIMPLWTEDPRYLTSWGTVLAHGVRRVTTVGTDAHRNTFPQELPDGERVDSFRRMMMWFSNHVLVEVDGSGAWDDTSVKQALRARRLYAAFEYMGYPEGFDARIEAGDAVIEIGGEVALGEAPTIVAIAPTVRELDPEVTPPDITVHVLQAVEGGFTEVASGTDEVEFVPTEAGAYRVEVRIVPRHLAGELGDYADLAEVARPWIYANAFYVDP